MKVAIKTVFHMLRSGVVSNPSLATCKIASRNPFLYCETPEEPGGGRGSWAVREATCKTSQEKYPLRIFPTHHFACFRPS